MRKQGYCNDLFTEAAITFIEKHRKGPFFVYLPYNIAHATTEVEEFFVFCEARGVGRLPGW